VTVMLSPDLLDRRALALLRLIDVTGRPVSELVLVHGEGVRSVRKKDGLIAILEAAGFEDYCASFSTPSSPAAGSTHVQLDLEPVTAELCPRRFDLALPRNGDPTKAGEPSSLFSPSSIEMLPGGGARLSGSACAIRTTVRRRSDKKLIQNALIRGQSADEKFEARGVTDPRGQAVLIFPSLPLSFPGAGANVRSDLDARVVVTVDLASARFNAPGDIPRMARAEPPFADPDALASAAVDFSSGAPVTIGAGREVSLNLEWSKP